MPKLRTNLLGATLVGAALLLTGCQGDEATTQAAMGTDNGTVAMGAVNENCPIMGSAVDPNGEMVDFMGHKVGFCCAGCVGKWNEMSDDDKSAFVTKAMNK